ncbi:receptor-like protein kinase [Seminavis robusta]|uniref:Circumsporozoite protein n=1 Tax=Seminavis robusta TaxID=568900 RepID=A0A9N8DD07_9STRA|nr:receptor-like protein kinase [Seminavis robusta]|eukprot:Sro86_g045620.1 receptor-like protein kinase (548) ;mRNA; f:30992-32635
MLFAKGTIFALVQAFSIAASSGSEGLTLKALRGGMQTTNQNNPKETTGNKYQHRHLVTQLFERSWQWGNRGGFFDAELDDYPAAPSDSFVICAFVGEATGGCDFAADVGSGNGEERCSVRVGEGEGAFERYCSFTVSNEAHLELELDPDCVRGSSTDSGTSTTVSCAADTLTEISSGTDFDFTLEYLSEQVKYFLLPGTDAGMVVTCSVSEAGNDEGDTVDIDLKVQSRGTGSDQCSSSSSSTGVEECSIEMTTSADVLITATAAEMPATSTFPVTLHCDVATKSPTISPTTSPTETPTKHPTGTPTQAPSSSPSVNPSKMPSVAPTQHPSIDPTEPLSENPSAFPSSLPSIAPSLAPSISPRIAPSSKPSNAPSSLPSDSPSIAPTDKPSDSPSQNPSHFPSIQPSKSPSASPSQSPSEDPSSAPSGRPSGSPSSKPSTAPSVVPSVTPSVVPSTTPSVAPSHWPSTSPSVGPSTLPSSSPSAEDCSDSQILCADNKVPVCRIKTTNLKTLCVPFQAAASLILDADAKCGCCSFADESDRPDNCPS